MRSIVPYQLLVNLYLTMIEPYFTYIIWRQFNKTLKNKLPETAFLLLKRINLSVGPKSFSVSGSKRWIEKPFDIGNASSNWTCNRRDVHTQHQLFSINLMSGGWESKLKFLQVAVCLYYTVI